MRGPPETRRWIPRGKPKEISMTKILVAYASKHNSTAEIATVIGEVLQRAVELQVDVRPVEEVKEITPYDAIVLGSAVYMAQWQPAAADFLKQHEQELT